MTLLYSILPIAVRGPAELPKKSMTWRETAGPDAMEAIANAVYSYLARTGPYVTQVTVFFWTPGAPVFANGVPKQIETIIFDCVPLQNVKHLNPNLN